MNKKLITRSLRPGHTIGRLTERFKFQILHTHPNTYTLVTLDHHRIFGTFNHPTLVICINVNLKYQGLGETCF